MTSSETRSRLLAVRLAAAVSTHDGISSHWTTSLNARSQSSARFTSNAIENKAKRTVFPGRLTCIVVSRRVWNGRGPGVSKILIFDDDDTSSVHQPNEPTTTTSWSTDWNVSIFRLNASIRRDNVLRRWPMTIRRPFKCSTSIRALISILLCLSVSWSSGFDCVNSFRKLVGILQFLSIEFRHLVAA